MARFEQKQRDPDLLAGVALRGSGVRGVFLPD
jgi:hypothetical protein